MPTCNNKEESFKIIACYTIKPFHSSLLLIIRTSSRNI
jgi:hypothetical protein